MRVYRDIGAAEQIYVYEEVRNAALLASLGEFERACAAIETFMNECDNEGIRIFAMREAIGWKEHQGLMDEVAYDAAECARRAREHWGQDDERTMIMLNTELYRTSRAGLVKKASSLAHTALKLAKANLSENDPLANAIRNNAAHAFVLNGERDQATHLYQGLLDDYERWGKTDSDEAMTTRDNYASYLLDSRQYDEALVLYRSQLAIFTNLWGSNNEVTLGCRNDVAMALYHTGDTHGANAMWRELSLDCNAHLETGHPLTIEVLTINIQSAIEAREHADVVRYSSQILPHLDAIGDTDSARTVRRLRNRHMEKEW